MRSLIGLFALLAAIFMAAEVVTVEAMAVEADAKELPVTIKNHRFEPAEIHVPANQAVTLKVTNEDPTPEEFESHGLDVEKIITGGQSAVIRLRPLDAG